MTGTEEVAIPDWTAEAELNWNPCEVSDTPGRIGYNGALFDETEAAATESAFSDPFERFRLAKRYLMQVEECIVSGGEAALPLRKAEFVIYPGGIAPEYETGNDIQLNGALASYERVLRGELAEIFDVTRSTLIPTYEAYRKDGASISQEDMENVARAVAEGLEAVLNGAESYAVDFQEARKNLFSPTFASDRGTNDRSEKALAAKDLAAVGNLYVAAAERLLEAYSSKDNSSLRTRLDAAGGLLICDIPKYD